MTKPTTVLTSMRLAHVANLTLILNVDLQKAAERHLNRIAALSQVACSLDELQDDVEKEAAAYALRRAELLARDRDWQREAELMRFADEVESA